MKIIQYLLFSIITFMTLITDVLAKIPNPYKVLGVPQDANQDQIKEGFKKRSKKYHPDRNKTDPRAKQKFQKIVNAYELLKDPQRRRIYDMTGDDNPQGMPGGQGGGFPGGFHGGFPGGFGGINIEDLFGGFGGFGGGFGESRGFGGQARNRRGGQQQGGRKVYTFSFGGAGPEGMRFQF